MCISSAVAGQADSPNLEEALPSFITPFADNASSWQWLSTGFLSIKAYSMQARAIAGFCIPCPSSENATAPAAAISAISERVFPARPFVQAPIG